MKSIKRPEGLFSKKAAIILLPLVVVLVVLLVVTLSTEEEREVVFKDYGYGFANASRLVSIMKVPGNETDVNDLLCQVSPDGKIIVKGDKVSYGKESLSPQLPLFFDNNSYIYIPWEEAVFLDTNLTVKSIEGNAFLIKEGFFGDDYTIRDSGKDLLLLSCTKNLFLALADFSVTSTGMKLEVKPMDLVLFDGYSVRTLRIADTTGYRFSNGIRTDSLVTVNGHDYFMKDFLSVLGLTVERDSSVDGLERMEVKEDKDTQAPKPIDDIKLKVSEPTVQYFLGNRYDYPEGLEVYKYDDIWYEKRDEFAAPIDGNPMYGEKYIWLPNDYGLADIYGTRVFSLPAFTKIEREQGKDGKIYVISADEKKREALPARSIIFDGYENYIFTSDAVISWRDTEIALSPLSYVNYDGAGRLGIYVENEDLFYSYSLETDSIKVRYPEGNGVDLTEKIILREGESDLPVFSQPGILGSFFETR